MKTEKDILDLIENDSFMMEILEIVATIDLEDYWVCAGFIRNKVWDTLYNCSTRTPYNDIDIVYFNSTDLSENHEKFIEEELYRKHPHIPWEVVNQARMYDNHPDVQASCASDGIASFPETPTSVGVKLKDNQLVMTAPHGIEDLVNGFVNPTPLFKQKKYINIYCDRLNKKSWHALWPNLIINKEDNRD